MRSTVRQHLAGGATTAALLLGLAVGGTGAAAQDASPEAGGGELPEGCEVVAEGLLNPRQLAIAEDGTLYVTEAGIGGDEEVAPPAEEPVVEEEVAELVGSPAAEAIVEEASPTADEEDEATPATGEAAEGGPEGEGFPPLNRGDTGQVTMVTPDGTQSVVAGELPSYSIGVGPAGIVVADGQLWVANGGAAPVLGIDPLPNENAVLLIDPETGDVTPIADLGAYEVENNPDGTDVNPNLYGMDLGADGQLYVADAGGNTVYRVDPATGEYALLGVIPELPLPEDETTGADASPEADAPTSLQAVPTGVDVGADGNVYVGLLGAEVPGAARVQIAQADGTFVDAATGLTAVVGVALGPDGALYASQISTNFAGEVPEPGNVVRVGEDGDPEVVVEELPVPNGIAFDQDGNLYVVVNSVAFGPGEPQGQVWRCEGVAAAASGGETALVARLDAAYGPEEEDKRGGRGQRPVPRVFLRGPVRGRRWRGIGRPIPPGRLVSTEGARGGGGAGRGGRASGPGPRSWGSGCGDRLGFWARALRREKVGRRRRQARPRKVPVLVRGIGAAPGLGFGRRRCRRGGWSAGRGRGRGAPAPIRPLLRYDWTDAGGAGRWATRGGATGATISIRRRWTGGGSGRSRRRTSRSLSGWSNAGGTCGCGCTSGRRGAAFCATTGWRRRRSSRC